MNRHMRSHQEFWSEEEVRSYNVTGVIIAEVLTNTSYVDPQDVSSPVPVALKKAPKGTVSFSIKESASTALERWFSTKRYTKTCTTTLQPAASLPTKRKAVPPVDEGLAEANGRY